MVPITVPTFKSCETTRSLGFITPRSSVPNVSDPLKPRCRNIFDPGVFSCAAGETWRNDPLYPKSPQKLTLRLVLCHGVPLKNRDTPWQLNLGDSAFNFALCLSQSAETPRSGYHTGCRLLRENNSVHCIPSEIRIRIHVVVDHTNASSPLRLARSLWTGHYIGYRLFPDKIVGRRIALRLVIPPPHLGVRSLQIFLVLCFLPHDAGVGFWVSHCNCPKSKVGE